MSRVNPFIYGRPLRPNEFFDREGELKSLWNRILTNQSSAVTGEPMIGKTSLLLKLSDMESFKEANGLDDSEAAKFKFVLFDCMTFETWMNPNGFWRKVLKELKRGAGDDTEFQKILERFEGYFDTFEDRKDFFTEIGRKGYKVVLMLDEFDTLLRHQNFKTSSFYGQLRHLANLTDGLVVIASSRMSVSELNEEGRGILNVGSPFFNNWIEFKLKGFDLKTINEFFNRSQTPFTDEDREFILSLAGVHPALLQGIASTLFEAKSRTVDPKNARQIVLGEIPAKFRQYFDDIWERFDSAKKLAAYLVGIGDMIEGPSGKHYPNPEIERIRNELSELNVEISELLSLRPVLNGLKELEELGFIYVDPENKEDYDVTSRAFLFWLEDKMGEPDFNPVEWAEDLGFSSKERKKLDSFVKKATQKIKALFQNPFIREIIVEFIIDGGRKFVM